MKVKREQAKQEPIKIDYENKRLSTIYFMPLLLIAGFVPLIVYAKYIDLTGTTQSLYWTGQQQYLDFFSYWKSRWVVALTLIGLIFYIILYKQKKLPFKNLKQYYIPLGIYAIFVIISTIFAIDTQTALWGFVDMYQGMFVLLSYVIITFLTINFVNSERDVNLFVNAFLFLMIVEGIIGVTQYFGFDFFQTTIGKSLIVPGNIQVDGLSFSFGPKTIYGTLFNTNYIGSFATLLLPMSVAILWASKTRKQKTLSGITVILNIFAWIGCNSSAGYLGVVIASLVAMLLFRSIVKVHWKVSLSMLLALLIAIVGFNSTSDGKIINMIKNININEVKNKIKENDLKIIIFKDIILGQDTFTIITNTETLNFKLDGDKLFFLDDNNNELLLNIKENIITIKDERYSGYKITIEENYPGVTVERAYRSFRFYFEDESVRLIGSGGRLIKPIKAESFSPLDGLEKIGSSRGYIWGRTIPLLKEYVIFGAGPDNFPMVFPQDDIVAKSYALFDPYTIVDKPHNLYLQVAVNTGTISLLMLLMIWGMYLISSLKLYSNIIFDTLEKYIGASCFIGVIGFLIAGLFNDYVVSVFPLFWIILGLGISINLRINPKNKKIK